MIVEENKINNQKFREDEMKIIRIKNYPQNDPFMLRKQFLTNHNFRLMKKLEVQEPFT